MKSSNSRNAALLLLMMCGLLGCDAGPPGRIERTDTYIQVTLNAAPVEGIVVKLHTGPGTPVLVQGVSGVEGRVYLMPPNPEPSVYHVSLDANTSGDWMLDPGAVESLESSTRLKPFQDAPVQMIALPENALRTSSPSGRRRR